MKHRRLKYTRFVSNLFAALAFGAGLAGCIKQEPSDPLAALFKAANIDLTGQAIIGTRLDLRSEWQRGCETRAGNLFADAAAWKNPTDIGFIAGGNIRDDNGITEIPRGTVTESDLVKVQPFNGDMVVVEMTAYRLKQALEAAVTLLGTSRSAADTDDFDSDGQQHGDCYYEGQSGNGRFLHPSSKLDFVVNVNNTAQTNNGDKNSLLVTGEGKRIVKMTFDNAVIYDNGGGDFATGWTAGSLSCDVGGGFHAGQNFSSSEACTKYSVTVADFQQEGGDFHPTFNPDLPEVNNDGSVTVTNSSIGIDRVVSLDYLEHLTEQFQSVGTPVKPEIEGRITFQ